MTLMTLAVMIFVMRGFEPLSRGETMSKTFAYVKLLSDKGYKPAGYRLEITEAQYRANKTYYQQYAVAKLCILRGWTMRDLRNYGYNQITVFFREV